MNMKGSERDPKHSVRPEVLRGGLRAVLGLLLVIFGLVAMEATPASADGGSTYYVSTAGATPTCAGAVDNSAAPFDTIQAALNCAASDSTTTSSPDTIRIASGVYVEHDSVAANVNLEGAGASTTAINGTFSGAVLTVSSPYTVGISGLTVENGKDLNGGGGIYNGGGTLTVTDDTFSQNGGDGFYPFAIGPGGGIYNGGGTLTATHDTFSGNGAIGPGGGIDNGGGTLTATHNTFSGNGAFLGGGAIATTGGTLTATDDTFSGNNGNVTGGAIYDSYSWTVTATNDTFSTNSAYLGGAIELDDCCTLTATGDNFSGNSAFDGGGIYVGGYRNSGATLTATDDTFSGNSATSGGGGINDGSDYGLGGSVTVADDTFAENNAAAAGAIVGGELGTTVFGSIVVGECLGRITDRGFNLDYGDAGANTCGFSATAGDVVEQDPQLGPLQENGGPTETMAITPASPAFHKIPDGLCPAVDQRGVSRPQPSSSSTCDIGAFEVVVPDTDLALSGVPAGTTVDATSPAGAVVDYTPPAAVDEDSPATASVACSPPTGSTFPIGTTTVTCTATDADDANSPVSLSFTVSVEGAAQQLSDLDGLVQGVGPGNSLPAKVAAARSALAAGDVLAVCGILGAFVGEVQAQSAKLIPAALAATLVGNAERIRAVLAC